MPRWSALLGCMELLHSVCDTGLPWGIGEAAEDVGSEPSDHPELLPDMGDAVKLREAFSDSATKDSTATSARRRLACLK